MNKNNFLSALLFTAFLFFVVFGLKTQAQTINEQFKTVVDSSNNYQEYKVIKQSQITKLWHNTVDSLNYKEAQHREVSEQLTSQKVAIEKQQTQLANKEKSLQETLNSVNEISFLGIFAIEKGSYRMFMWGLIVILLILALVFYFISFSARKEAKYRIKLFEEVQEEFKNYKAKTNENEKKLARALQDERNKLAEHNIN